MAKPKKATKQYTQDKHTMDSFVNFMSKLGLGSDNQSAYSTYSLYPQISRNHVLLEAAYRSSWIVGQVVDTVAEDMTREGITINSDIDPDEVKKIQSSLVKLNVWHQLSSIIKWARLYGGAIGVILTEGADYEKPINYQAIRKGSFKGILTLDRWQIDPSFGELVTEISPDMGMPKYYRVVSGNQIMSGQKVHYSRIIRFDGIELPYYQKMAENLWGLSVVERMWDRLLAFDSATTGAAQMLYKAYLRVIGIEGLREALALGGAEESAVIKQFQYIALLQSMEGITLLDQKDKFETHQYTFSGVSDVLIQFGQQISGATGIPLVRLFGQSPAGLSATGESDLRNYYDHINKLQNFQMLAPLTRILQIMFMSVLGKEMPEDFEFEFNSLWQMDDKEKADMATAVSNTVIGAYGSGIITKKIALKEFKQQSRITGIFTNITDEDIKNAVEEPLPDQSIMIGTEPEGGDNNLSFENMEQELASIGIEHDDIANLESQLEEIGTDKNIVSKMGVKDKLIRFKDSLLSKIMKPLGLYFIIKEATKEKETLEQQIERILGPQELRRPQIPAVLGSALDRKKVVDTILTEIRSIKDEFEESKHPRVKSGKNAGEFAKKGETGTSAPVATKSTQGFKSLGNKVPEHISKLKIPPAWTNVAYNPDPKGSLMVVGYDTKGRRQSIYSEKHTSEKAKAKFARINELNKKMDRIFKEVDAKMKRSETYNEALLTKLIMATGIRPGSNVETQGKVKAYGATTLEGRHVVIDNGTVALSFIGKKGVPNHIPIEDKAMAATLLKLKKKAGDTGRLFNTDYNKLLSFTHTLDGGRFKTKDFRTWVGTTTAMKVVNEMEAPINENEYKKKIKEVAKQVSAKLGNTPTVALQSYISPVVFADWKARI